MVFIGYTILRRCLVQGSQFGLSKSYFTDDFQVITTTIWLGRAGLR